MQAPSPRLKERMREQVPPSAYGNHLGATKPFREGFIEALRLWIDDKNRTVEVAVVID